MERSLAIRCLFAALAFLTTAAALPAEIDRQRALFRETFPQVERGNWDVVDRLNNEDRATLRRYVLWPDLRATWLKARVDKTTDDEIEAFLTEHGTLKPARELRYRHALNLARQGRLADYLEIYEQFYQGQSIAKLDCLALQAELDAGRTARVDRRAIELWTVGKSQVDECDPVFAYLGDQNLLGIADYRRRFELAVDARNFTLARWLAKKIDQRHVDIANAWLDAQNRPETYLRNRGRETDTELSREQLVYAAERLTYRDPELAAELWKDVVRRGTFSNAQKYQLERHIALWMARDRLPGAYKRLARLPSAVQTDEVLRWRARVSLRAGRWKSLVSDIAAMSDAERATEEWRYWNAFAQIRAGQALAALPDLEELSEERSYYGFLAADELKRDYALQDTGLLADEAALTALASRPAIVRARELFYVGLDSRGRSEWDALVRHLNDDEKLQAAILAHRWGWHSRAISTAASLGEYDDLSLRYPLPYKETFERSSANASIAMTWAYGIARSESLFMRDVRSSAGAIGLMQLMPATGRQVAKSLKLPYSGLKTLTDPEHNIRLGTTYLGQMVQRYGGNHVPATAAYNAGPHRVDRWLPENGQLDARIWIENIPFNETRKYVKRVLAAQTVFHWRLTGRLQRLSDRLPRVEPQQEQLAAQ